MKFDTIDNRARTAPPPLGYHTSEVLSQILNFDEEEVEQLRNDGAVL